MQSAQIKLGSCLIVFCLIFVVSLAPGAVSSAAAAGNNKNLVVVYLAPLVEQPKLCVGQTKTYPVTVQSGSWVPVSGAAILVDGQPTAYQSGKSGSALAPYTAKKAGKFTFEVTATKSGFGASNSQSISGEAQECGWRIRMDYEEAVQTQSGKFFQATCWMKFPNQTFKRDEKDNLVLTTGETMIEAKYGCDTGGLEYPLKVTMDTKVEGDMKVQFTGKYVNGALQITLKALTVALPKTVTLQVEDAVRGGSAGPSVTWAMQEFADVINKAKVTNWMANPIFDSRVYQTTKSLFWSESGMSLSGGNAYFIVELDKATK